MLQVQSDMARHAIPVHAFRGKGESVRKQPVSCRPPLIKTTWSAVEVVSDALSKCPHDAVVEAACEAYRTALADAKEELLFVNIAPGIPVGDPKVGECQAATERAVSDACKKMSRQPPEMRLSLRGSEYDLRCYIGHYRPSDFNFDV